MDIRNFIEKRRKYILYVLIFLFILGKPKEPFNSTIYSTVKSAQQQFSRNISCSVWFPFYRCWNGNKFMCQEHSTAVFSTIDHYGPSNYGFYCRTFGSSLLMWPPLISIQLCIVHVKIGRKSGQIECIFKITSKHELWIGMSFRF